MKTKRFLATLLCLLMMASLFPISAFALEEEVHSLNHVDAREPNCTEDGNYEYWFCQNPGCGMVFTDYEGENPTTREAVTRSSLGHDWGAWTSAGDGVNHTRTCQRDGCGATETEAHHADAILNGSSSQHNYVCYVCDPDSGVGYRSEPHTFGDWTDNGDGTHSRSCICGRTETETHSGVTATEPDAEPMAEPARGLRSTNMTVFAAAASCTVDLYLDPGPEAGTVSVSPASGWTVGQEITLTATAYSGYTFMWWVNYATGENSRSSTYTTTLTGDCEWDAVFRKNGEYFIYISKPWVENDPSQTLQVSPDASSYTSGTTITLNAPAKSGRSVVYEYGRDVDGQSSSVTSWTRIGGNSFSMPAYDVWARGLYSVNLTLSTGAHGTATLSPSSGPYYEGDTVTLTVNPDSGYRAVISNIPAGYTVSGDTYTFTVGESDLTISVEFEELPAISLAVRAYPDDAAGSASISQNETNGEVTLTATPKDGYHFLGWYDVGSSSFISQANPYTFEPTQSMTIFAYFYVSVYKANVEHGTLEIVDEKQVYAADDVVTLMGTPDEGYVLDYYLAGKLEGNSANLEPLEGDSFTMPAYDMAVGVKFAKLHTISALASPNEGGTVSGAGQYKNGAVVTLTATANSGYRFVNWTENGAEVSADATCSFTASANRTLVANFELIPVKHTISASASPAAGGTVSGAGEYEEGKTVTLTATANSGYHFVNWTENGSQVSASESYSFTAAANRTLTANFQQGNKIAIQVDTSALSTLTPGQSFRVPVRVTTNTGFAGAQIKLSFDNSKLTLDSLELGEFADPVTPGQQGVSTRYIRVGSITTETGVLFYANFTVKSDAAPGATEIGFEETLLSDASASAITGSFTSGMVTISQSDTVISYPLWVSGVQVTSANKGDVLGGGSGVTYDPDTQTLTFPENITLTGAYSNTVILAVDQNLTVQAPKGLTLNNSDAMYGIEVTGIGKGLTVETGGVLAITVKNYGLSAGSGGVTVTGNVNITVGQQGIMTSGPVTVNGDVTIRNSSYGVNANGKVELSGGDIDIETNGFCILTYGDIALDYGTCTLTNKGSSYYAILGNNITLEGTSFTAVTRANGYDCVLAEQKLTLVRGDFSFTGGYRAIQSSGDIEIQSGVTRVVGKCTSTWYSVICAYGGEIKLADNLRIVTPEDGYINNTDYSKIVDKDGNKVSEVVIEKAPEPVPYVNAAGQDMEPVKTYTPVKADTTAWDAEWIVVTEDVTVTERITVSGSVNLILCDGATLTAPKGITVEGSNSLTIWQQTEGSGKLTASSETYTAAIGGRPNNSAGTIVINGGYINARGGKQGSGIGGGGAYNYSHTGGSGGVVIVNGGNVTARGGLGAPGIGGGACSAATNNAGNGGVFTMTGGTVTAVAGNGAQAIGHGRDDDNTATSGELHIDGIRVFYPANTLAADRETACRGGSVTLTVCSPHEYENGACKWCGKVDVDYTLYPLWVGGVQVSNENKDNILGDGTAKYDPSTATLTLTNASITATSSNQSSGGVTNSNVVYARGLDLTVSLSGDNTLGDGSTGHAIMSDQGSLAIMGSGSLTAVSGKNSAIHSTQNSISITGITVTATSSDTDGIFADRSVTITDSTVTSTGIRYGITAINGAITISGADSVVTASGGRMALRATNSGVVTLNDGLAYIEGEATAKKAVIKFPTYTVTVVGGTADVSKAKAGETVTITADAPEAGYAFNQWALVDGVDFANASAAETTFTMPAQNVTVTAVFPEILLPAIGDKTYTGEAIEPSFGLPDVKLDGVDGIFVKGTDYDLSYSDNVDVGTATVTLTMLSPRTGSKSVTFRILPADLTEAAVSAIPGQEYTGGAITPEPAVTWNGKTLVKGTDYTLSYENNTDAGTATVTLTGCGSFTGTKTATFEITPKPLTVTAEAKSKTYGEADPALTYTADGLVGSDTITGELTRAAGENAGTYAVTQGTLTAGDNYAIDFTGAELTIGAKALTITAEAKSKTYGKADPALIYTADGLVGSDTITGELTRAAGENAGSYAITQGTLTAGDNYAITFTGAELAIEKAAITITVDDKSSKYGEDIAELTYQIGGEYKTGDDLGVTVTTTATRTSDVGEYPITVSWNENPNYSATMVNGKYTITKTDLAVSAAGYSGVYDKAAHGITVDVGSSDAAVYYAETELTSDNYSTAGSTANPTYTDAGEYTVYFYVVSGNYVPDTVSGSKTVVITAASGTADETQGETPMARTGLAYTGEPQVLVTAPTNLPEGYDKVQYSLDGGTTWTDSLPTGTDAGDYTVSVRYLGDKNHEDFSIASIPVTIRATWTVKYEMGGAEAIDDQKVVDGEKPVKPADPAWDGYSFDGWYADGDFKTVFDFSAAITADTTVYAKWTAIGYAVTAITGTTADSSHTWRKGSTTPVVITVKPVAGEDHSFAHFVGVDLDGTILVLEADYTAHEGSTVVTLKPAMLEKISLGDHTVTILFDNGKADVRLTIKAAPTSPATGDDRVTGLWAMLTILSAMGMGGVAVFVKKRRYSGKH